MKNIKWALITCLIFSIIFSAVFVIAHIDAMYIIAGVICGIGTGLVVWFYLILHNKPNNSNKRNRIEMSDDVLDQYIQYLKYGADINTQQDSINTLINRNDYNLSKLILPLRTDKYSKHYWENAAIVISKKSPKEIEKVLPDLFIWLKDLNWPGSMIILDCINKLPDELIIPQKRAALEFAYGEDDEMWIENIKLVKK